MFSIIVVVVLHNIYIRYIDYFCFLEITFFLYCLISETSRCSYQWQGKAESTESVPDVPNVALWVMAYKHVLYRDL